MGTVLGPGVPGLWAGVLQMLGARTKRGLDGREGVPTAAWWSPADSTLVPKERTTSRALQSIRSGCQSKSHAIDPALRCWNYVFVCRADGAAFE